MSQGNGGVSLTAKDFKTDQEVRWCPGCGDYAILAAVQSFLPELNLGQLAFLLRGTYLVDAVGYNRVKGKPFRIQEIVDEAVRLLDERG